MPTHKERMMEQLTKTETGFFGQYGGAFVPEELQTPLEELKTAFKKAEHEPVFTHTLEELRRNYIGRPSPLLYAENASKALGGADIYIKLEGLANTGAHKINNAMGQALLAKQMGKKEVVAETGAGQHGLASAAACARLGLQCRVFMGEKDYLRQYPNVLYMELFGAEVIAVPGKDAGLKEAVGAAFDYWMDNIEECHYLLGSALGPDPFPRMVESFQSVIGTETVQQLEERSVQADLFCACVGGGSNAAGFFHPYLDLPADIPNRPRLLAAEAGGRGLKLGDHAVRISDAGKPGTFQGYRSRFLMDAQGKIADTHSISAGLDYPGIGPRFADAAEDGRVEFTRVDDNQTLEALRFFARHEGLLFALESAHAGYAGMQAAQDLGQGSSLVINMSGRGDKDLFISAKALAGRSWKKFLEQELEQLR